MSSPIKFGNMAVAATKQPIEIERLFPNDFDKTGAG